MRRWVLLTVEGPLAKQKQWEVCDECADDIEALRALTQILMYGWITDGLADVKKMHKRLHSELTVHLAKVRHKTVSTAEEPAKPFKRKR